MSWIQSPGKLSVFVFVVLVIVSIATSAPSQTIVKGELEGEGVTEGVTEGIIEGVVEGSLDGEGGVEGVVEGSTEGEIEGLLEGAAEGEGGIDGEAEGASEGSTEGLVEGSVEGITEGLVEGSPEGEGAPEGLVEGAAEGDGEIEGAVDGEVEGSFDGEGAPDGESEGEGEDVDPDTQVVYVDRSRIEVEPPADGLSWATAFSTLQEGVDAAALLERPEVWVARGVYDLESTESGALEMADNVALYGGFRGGETARGQRDPLIFVCVIDGSQSDNGEAAEHVVEGANGARLDGFTIRGGVGDGGGLLANGVTMSVWNCIFRDNDASRFGGGLLAVSGADVTVIDSIFRDNTADINGGGVSVSNATLYIQGVLFYRNSTGGVGGAVYCGVNSDVTLSSCRITENTAISGAGLASLNGAGLRLSGSWVGRNTASELGGGAQLVSTSGVALVNSVFSLNRADIHGGAINNQQTSPLISQCTFSGNSAQERGWAIYNQGNSSPVIVNTIIANTGGEVIGNLDEGQPIVNFSLIEGVPTAGTQNLSSNPRFVDEANEVYGLGSGSPAVDTGRDVSTSEFGGETTDFVGNARGFDGDGFGAISGDGSEYDMGAFEAPFQGDVGDSREVPKPEHAGDTNQDYVFDLTELLRIVQLYNAGNYGCASVSTEDGYEPNGVNETCDPHSSDYTDGDFVITLSELLRSLQLFNLGGYYLCPGVSEDNFCGAV